MIWKKEPNCWISHVVKNRKHFKRQQNNKEDWKSEETVKVPGNRQKKEQKKSWLALIAWSWTKREITENITCCCSTAMAKWQCGVTVNNKIKTFQALKKAKSQFWQHIQNLSRQLIMVLLETHLPATGKELKFPSPTGSFSYKKIPLLLQACLKKRLCA